jgi:hypothetical protein
LDFTLKTYCTLLGTLQKSGYTFQTFSKYLISPGTKIIILRHDVDRQPENSLVFARIQHELGIRGTYYFRTVPQSWDEKIIREISALGHEIGYHYEDVSLAAERQKTKDKRQKIKNRITNDLQNRKTERLQDNWCLENELVDVAIESFRKNLQKLREIAPVKTICMHGSPMSRWDSRLLWKYYDYHEFGIIGEPYFDINFNEVPYLTDTGRRWDGDSFNFRDKAPTPLHFHPLQSSFHSTYEIIKAAHTNHLPPNIMITIHPQRWTSNPLQWLQELVSQNVKNVGKFLMIKVRNRQ